MYCDSDVLFRVMSLERETVLYVCPRTGLQYSGQRVTRLLVHILHLHHQHKMVNPSFYSASDNTFIDVCYS